MDDNERAKYAMQALVLAECDGDLEAIEQVILRSRWFAGTPEQADAIERFKAKNLSGQALADYQTQSNRLLGV